MLAALQRVTERQIEAEAHAVCLEDELKLDRNMHLLMVGNKDALGRQLEQTSEQLQNLACRFARAQER